MRPRIFTMPFTRLGDFPELDFGPDETLTVRPFFSQDTTTTTALLARIVALAEEAQKDDHRPDAEMQGDSDQVIIDLLNLCVVEWTLRDGEGKTIPVPKTPAQLRALPTGLAGAFFDFCSTFRGDGPNPTTGS